MANTVRYLDLPAQLDVVAAELRAGFDEALATASLIGGPKVDAFEAAFARYCGTGGCVGVANGTDALVLAMRVLDIGPGDVVLVPAATFVATASAVVMVGATPRFVDIDPATYTIDPRTLSETELSGVKAVIPVHLYGQPADMQPILAWAKEHGIVVLEDAAQAHGARYGEQRVGSFGALATFSFYPGKNLGALGDAGAVVGNDQARLSRLRRLSNHGRTSHTEYGEIGPNSRLDALQAMALGVKLPYLDGWNEARARVADWYDACLADLDGVTTPARAAQCTHVFHVYCLQTEERDALRERLDAAGIQSAVHYPLALPQQPAFAHLGYEPGSMPHAEGLAARCVSLPIYPELTRAEVDRVSDVIREHVRAGG